MSVHKWLFLVSVWRRDPMHDSIQIFAQLKLETLRVESLPSRSGCRRQTTNASIHLGLQERKNKSHKQKQNSKVS